MDLEETEMVYRAEGNANVVLYLPQIKKVLRLQKNTLPNKDTEENEGKLNLNDRIKYMKLFNHFLGLEFSCELQAVKLTTQQTKLIESICKPQCPKNRLADYIILQNGILMQDATLITSFKPNNRVPASKFNVTFSVEIKPKQGWRIQDITNANLLKEFNFQSLEKCRYCSVQFLKLKQNKIQSPSEFCPIDFFSGTYDRMSKALDGLLKEPQNNFRFFKNGIQCYGDFENSITLQQLHEQYFENNIDFFKKLWITVLLKRISDNSFKFNSEKLPQGSILHTLLNMQILARDNMEFMLSEKSKKLSYEYLPDLLRKTEFSSMDCLTQKEKYMIGATAMDSSIMLAYQEISYEDDFHDKNIIEINGRKFITQIKILDIDPKTDFHFEKYLKQTNKAYLETFLFLNNSKTYDVQTRDQCGK